MTRGRFEDLTGQKFGEWTVIERTANAGRHVMFLCRCSCGTEASVQSGNLRGGKTTRCMNCAKLARLPKSSPSQIQRPKGPAPEDMIGRQFGEWTVLSFAGLTKARQRRWLCRCSCGNQAMVQAGNLRSGRSKSCVLCGFKRSAERRRKSGPR